MYTNFLEELAAEWLEYQGYIVKRNERVSHLAKGGYGGELDVVGFNPKKKEIIHIETSFDAGSWSKREEKMSIKFELGEIYIKEKLFSGLELPSEINKIVILGFASDKKYKTLGGGEVKKAIDYIIDIIKELKKRSFFSNPVPEKFPILRILHMITWYKEKVYGVLKEK